MEYKSVHVGTKRAFGKWKLILIDHIGICSMIDISEKVAKTLISAGMNHEG